MLEPLSLWRGEKGGKKIIKPGVKKTTPGFSFFQGGK
jgi:hypothetical protein